MSASHCFGPTGSNSCGLLWSVLRLSGAMLGGGGGGVGGMPTVCAGWRGPINPGTWPTFSSAPIKTIVAS